MKIFREPHKFPLKLNKMSKSRGSYPINFTLIQSKAKKKVTDWYLNSNLINYYFKSRIFFNHVNDGRYPLGGKYSGWLIFPVNILFCPN